jgi:hypothetical protein
MSSSVSVYSMTVPSSAITSGRRLELRTESVSRLPTASQFPIYRPDSQPRARTTTQFGTARLFPLLDQPHGVLRLSHLQWDLAARSAEASLAWYDRELAIGQTLTDHDVPLFGDLTWYVSAVVSTPVADGQRTSMTLTPGMRTAPGPRLVFPGRSTNAIDQCANRRHRHNILVHGGVVSCGAERNTSPALAGSF